MTDVIKQFTLDEAIARAILEPPANATASRKDDGDFIDVSFEESVRMARHGDPTTALDLKRRVGALASFMPAPRATQRYGVAGSTVDVGRFLAGEPENMVETVRARRATPVIKIAIERSVPYYVTPSDIRATGASVLAGIEALRTAGVPSEIWCTYTTNSGGYKVSSQVLVQEAGRPIDIDRLAFWACNPGSLRRIGFSIWEQEDADIRDAVGIKSGYGYGSAGSKPPGDWDEIAPGRESEVTAWLKDILTRRAGVTVVDHYRR